MSWFDKVAQWFFYIFGSSDYKESEIKYAEKELVEALAHIPVQSAYFYLHRTLVAAYLDNERVDFQFKLSPKKHGLSLLGDLTPNQKVFLVEKDIAEEHLVPLKNALVSLAVLYNELNIEVQYLSYQYVKGKGLRAYRH